MKRTRSRVVLAVAIVAAGMLAVPSVSHAQLDPAQVQISVHPVASGVWMLQGAGGNIGVSAGDDGVFLVDDQYAPLTEKILAAIRTVSERPVRFVVNTHWHGDHTGGNENLGKAGAVIVAHHNVRERMSTEQFMERFGETVPASPHAALPVITFAEGVTFHLNGDTLEVVHLPAGHTDGDSAVIWEEADVIHAGDLFFNGMYPFIDLGSGGSIDGMIAAIEVLLERAGDGTRIVPGHGPLATRADLAAYHAVLEGARARVAALIAEGRSREEVLAADPTAEWNEKWGGGFIDAEAFAGTIYDSLKGE
ncbi:MAG TPA: MBL fold metallo-hydrolase [Thermoanaerobaculia bacterium]|nr:MBL fold metallo-hydrolase [Thermoanaerobaculia bacterium]